MEENKVVEPMYPLSVCLTVLEGTDRSKCAAITVLFSDATELGIDLRFNTKKTWGMRRRGKGEIDFLTLLQFDGIHNFLMGVQKSLESDDEARTRLFFSGIGTKWGVHNPHITFNSSRSATMVGSFAAAVFMNTAGALDSLLDETLDGGSD